MTHQSQQRQAGEEVQNNRVIEEDADVALIKNLTSKVLPAEVEEGVAAKLTSKRISSQPHKMLLRKEAVVEVKITAAPKQPLSNRGHIPQPAPNHITTSLDKRSSTT